MRTTPRKVVFISYSWKDKSVADRVRESIPDQFEVWIDREQIGPGESVSKAILDGLNGSDYYVLLISENSVSSNWVKREIATAFELANKTKLSVIPVLLQGAEVPFEFKGLLYIDFRSSVAAGLQTLRDFFMKQAEVINDIEPRRILLKSQDERIRKRLACNELLRQLQLGDLRYLVSDRLSLEEVEVVWFDLFHRRMSDEVQVRNLALSCVELIDKSRRTDLLVDLMDTLCRNYPFISKGL
jgi:TIR domain